MKVIFSLTGSQLYHQYNLTRLSIEAQHACEVIAKFFALNDLWRECNAIWQNEYTANYIKSKNELFIQPNDTTPGWVITCSLDGIYSCLRAEYIQQNKIDVSMLDDTIDASAYTADVVPLLRHWVAYLEAQLPPEQPSNTNEANKVSLPFTSDCDEQPSPSNEDEMLRALLHRLSGE